MSRYFVGGATGFLGKHLVRAILERGDEPVPVARGGGEVHGVPVLRVDLLDEARVVEAARGCAGAYLAFGTVSRNHEDAAALFRTHVEGTRTALIALRAAGVRRVVFTSTSGTVAVGTDPDRTYDESSTAPLEIIARWPYYRSKRYAEREALEANTPPDFEVVVVNPSLLLGPGDVHESSTGDIRRFLERGIPAVPAGGLSFVDVRDAASAMLAAMDRGRPGERYLLTAKNTTVAAFFQRLERISGVKGPRLPMPKNRALAIGSSRIVARAFRAIGADPPIDEASVEMAQYFWYCDPSKAVRELGFAPRDPGETLRDTIEDIVEAKRAFPKGARIAATSSE